MPRATICSKIRFSIECFLAVILLTLCLVVDHAFARSSSFTSVPDTELEKILSEALSLTSRLNDLGAFFKSHDENPLLSTSTDLKRLERFYFDSADSFHKLAILYARENPNEYLSDAKTYWQRYIDWYTDTIKEDPESFSNYGVADRIHRATQYYVSLVHDLEGNAATLNLFESGSIDTSYLNDKVMRIWIDIVRACWDQSSVTNSDDSACSCEQSRNVFVQDANIWVDSFDLRNSMKRRFKQEIGVIGNHTCNQVDNAI